MVKLSDLSEEEREQLINEARKLVDQETNDRAKKAMFKANQKERMDDVIRYATRELKLDRFKNAYGRPPAATFENGLKPFLYTLYKVARKTETLSDPLKCETQLEYDVFSDIAERMEKFLEDFANEYVKEKKDGK